MHIEGLELPLLFLLIKLFLILIVVLIIHSVAWCISRIKIVKKILINSYSKNNCSCNLNAYSVCFVLFCLSTSELIYEFIEELDIRLLKI